MRRLLACCALCENGIGKNWRRAMTPAVVHYIFLATVLTFYGGQV